MFLALECKRVGLGFFVLFLVVVFFVCFLFCKQHCAAVQFVFTSLTADSRLNKGEGLVVWWKGRLVDLLLTQVVWWISCLVDVLLFCHVRNIFFKPARMVLMLMHILLQCDPCVYT